jgi:FkbM family methyltransferase
MALPRHIKAFDPISAATSFQFAGEISLLREPEIEHLETFVAEGATVLDIGVHLGQYAENLAGLVGPTGHVVGIEPVPEFVTYLRTAITALNLPVEIIEGAASDHAGSTTMHIPVVDGNQVPAHASIHPHSGQSYRSFETTLVRLDDLDLSERPISFVKIDVEGHELQVLKGAADLIRKHRPVLLVEIEHRHSAAPIEETFKFLEELGYSGSFIDDEGDFRPVSEFDPEQHQLPEDPDRRYINNFFFMPDGTDMAIDTAERLDA